MKKGMAWALCVLWMAVIFAMSAAPGDISGAQSGAIVQWIASVAARLTGASLSASAVNAVHVAVRKGAHMAEYAVLFWLYARALKASGAARPRLFALLMCAGYAATDEIHQGFVAGRGPAAMDVMIDTLGAACAWGISALFSAARRWRRSGKDTLSV